MRIRRLAAAGAIATLVVALAGACTSSKGTPDQPVTKYDNNSATLNIVAGSEQAEVFEKIVKPWCNDQKITCNYTQMGSVDQARLLATDNPFDAFWFASSVFEQLGNQQHKLQSVKPMFSTPIVYAGWKSEMERLGFVNREVTIEEVLQAVESKKTKVWVTNPTQSNSGATVLFGFLNHFAGNGPGVALTQAQLDSEPVQAGVTRFSQAFDHTPPSTGTLMNECTAHPDQCKTLFTYEDLVIEKNQELVAAGKEPLYAVYPKGSLAISDAPLGFLPHGNNPEKEATFKKLQDYLLTDAAQQKLLSIGRRPITSIGLSLPNAPKDAFNPDWGIQATLREQPIVYPAVSVIQSALNNYQTKYRTPADVVYCIDGSGSMGDNDGWKGVLQAAGLLFDPVQSAQVLLQVNPADRTTVLIFADKVKAGPWTVNGNDPAQLLDLKKKIEGQGPGGGTGIYRCLTKGAETFKTTPSGHKPLMILMTDGHNTDGGKDLNAIKAAGVPVIAIGFGGDIDEGALQEIANQTGGVYIKSNDLAGALRQATGYK